MLCQRVEFVSKEPLLHQQVFQLYMGLGVSCVLPPSQLCFRLKIITVVNIRGEKSSDALHGLCLVLVLHVDQLLVSYESC